MSNGNKKQVLNKKELIQILIDLGYEEEDLKENNKFLTNAKLEQLIEKEKADFEEIKEIEEDETITVASKVKIKDDDKILVMNGLSGSLTHRSRSTGKIWRFGGFGQTEKIPYSELLTLRNLSPQVYTDGWIIVLNKDVQEEFGLKDLYKNILTPKNITEVFKKSEKELSEFIDNLPDGMKVTFINTARELYLERELDSRVIIELIEDKFNISLDDNAPLTDIV